MPLYLHFAEQFSCLNLQKKKEEKRDLSMKKVQQIIQTLHNKNKKLLKYFFSLPYIWKRHQHNQIFSPCLDCYEIKKDWQILTKNVNIIYVKSNLKQWLAIYSHPHPPANLHINKCFTEDLFVSLTLIKHKYIENESINKKST